jgi:hypothetical protein
MALNKVKPKLEKNDQGLPGWNVYCGRDMDFSKVSIHLEAGTIYFEQIEHKPKLEEEKVKR